jgi:SSS family solute:Na+ symporter
LRLLFAPEAGAPFAVVGEAWRAGRLTLGDWDFSWHSLFDTQTTTAWLFILAFMVQWSRRYISDQHLVQRYLLARSDAEASRAVFAGALICVPVFFVFMFIGACFYGFFSLAHVAGPPRADDIMPFFMLHYLPGGLLGLVFAAILAAAMSTVSSDLNSVATVATTDFFATFFPKTSERTRLICGRVMVAVGGLCAASAALLLIPSSASTAPVMERAVTVAAILSGGTLGLFSLGFLTRRATREGCYVGIACCVIFTTWAILTEPNNQLFQLPRWFTENAVLNSLRFTMNPILIGIFGHFILFGTGYLASRIIGGYRPPNVDRLTFRGNALAAAAAAENADAPSLTITR